MARSFLLRTVTLALVSFVALPASAQTVPSAQTGTASPGRVDEQITRPDFDSTPQAPVEVKQGVIDTAPPGSDQIKFVLRDIEIDGVTAYDPASLSPLYADQIGQTISLADLYDIAAKITRTFRNDGYILTQVVVPPQSISTGGGTAKLRVVEGYIDTVTVQMEEGARPETESSMRLIREYAARIKTGNSLNVRDLERNMLLINDLPGVTARGVLAPSAAKVGGADLTILVKRKSFDGLLSVDNYGTRFLGPWQFSGAASTNSLLGYNERLTMQAVVAPQPGENVELGYLALDYVQPLMANGLKLNLTANHTETNPGYRLKPFNVRGHASYFGASLSYPVIRSRATSLYTTGTFDMRDVNTSNNLELTRRDSIRAVRGNARLEHLDTFFGAGLNIAEVEVAKGVDLFGASTKSNPNKSRADGDPTFTKFNVELQRLQRLAKQVNLLGGLRGQISDSPLLTSEQFGVGGMGYGRGYDPSEIIGDSGMAGKLELQWNIPGEFSITHDNQVFGFYDIGKIWLRNTPDRLQTETAASAGFGFRSKIMQGTSADFTVAVPLTRNVQTEGDQDPRLFFSLSHKF